MPSLTHKKSVWAFMLVMLALGSHITPTLAQAPEPGNDEWLPVTIVYNSDVIGKIEPCG